MTAKQTLEAMEMVDLARQVKAALEGAAGLHDRKSASVAVDIVVVALLSYLGYPSLTKLYNQIRPRLIHMPGKKRRWWQESLPPGNRSYLGNSSQESFPLGSSVGPGVPL